MTWTFAEVYEIFGVKWDFCRTDFSTRTFAEVMIGTFAELQNSRMYCKTKINVGIYVKFILKKSLIIELTGYVHESNRLCLVKNRHLKYLIAKNLNSANVPSCTEIAWTSAKVFRQKSQHDYIKCPSAKVPIPSH